MAKDFDELVCDFIDAHGKVITATMYVLNGGKTADEITSEDVEQFLMDCFTEGLEVLKTRAIQMVEQEVKAQMDDFDSRNGNNEDA